MLLGQEALSIESLERFLKPVGWSIHRSPNGLNDYILKPDKKRTGWRILSDRIEFVEDGFSCNFYFKECIIEQIDERCVSIFASVNSSVFINFYHK